MSHHRPEPNREPAITSGDSAIQRIASSPAQLEGLGQSEGGALFADAPQHTEGWYRSLLGAISDSVVLFDREWRHVFVNDAAARMVRMTPPNLIGKRIQELFPDVEQTELFAALEQAMHSRVASTIVHELKPPGADEGRWYEERIYPTPDGVLCIARDITEWQKAEDTLRAGERRFRALFEQSIDPIYIVAPDGSSIEANQAWLDLFGYTREELSSLTAPDFYADPAERADFLRRIARDGFVRDEMRMRRKDGTVFDCERHVVALKDESGALVAFQGVHRDATERKRAEETLRRSEAFTRSVLDSLPIGIAVNTVQPDVRFEYMNDNFARFYRTTREALSEPDAFWDAVYEDPDFRTQMRQKVLDDCATGDPERMRWQDIPITRGGEPTTYVSAVNKFIAEKGVMLSAVWDVTHRVEAAKEVRASEDRFRSLFAQSLDAIMIVHPDGALLDVNKAWTDMFKYTLAESASLHAKELHVDPVERDTLMRNIADTGVVHNEVRYKRKDGTVFDARRTVTAVRDDEGTPKVYQVVVCDATELKQAEERGRQQRIFSDALMETSPACILVFNAKGEVVFANFETDRVLGVPRDRAMGMVCGHDFILLDPNGAPVSEGEPPTCRVLRTETPMYSTEYAFDSPDGRRILSVSAAPLRDATGTASRVVATIEDVTSRKRTEEALRESERRYRGLFDQSLDIVMLVDLDGRTVDVNPAATPLFGYSREHLVGLPVWTYLREAERPLALEMLSTIKDTGSLPPLLPFHVQRSDGVEVPIEANVTLLYEKGVLIGVEIIARDISERKLRETERAESVARLHRAMAATVEAMVTAVEMRDPYTAGHQSRVTKVAVAIARELGLSDDPFGALPLAGQVHDLGKLRVPAEILTKPGRLTEIEFQLIKEHPRASYDMLKGIDFPGPVAEIAYQHHERLDGTGYPRGLKGGEILREARILAVADVFEAMASHRPYRPALGVESALEELERGRDSVYDSEAVDALARLVREKGFALD